MSKAAATLGERAKVTATLQEGGILNLPEEYRKALGLKPGDEVVLKLEDGAIRVFSLRSAIEQVQELVMSYVPEGSSLSDELVAERRGEADRE